MRHIDTPVKPFRSFLFASFTVLMFFGFIETVLHLSGFQPTLHFKKHAIPAWMEEFDPLFLEKYKNLVIEQNFVNEDAYAYQPDLRYQYLLKPDLNLTVSNYSSAIFVGKLPAWTIASDSKGNRISARNPAANDNNLEPRIIHVLGDSSSFGWGVDFEDSYPQQLMAKLKQSPSFSGMVVKNHSTPGFTSFQGRMLLEDKVKIKKGDIVLVSFGSNDSYPSIKSDRLRFDSRNSMVGKINWYFNRLLTIKGLRSLINLFPNPRVAETNNRRVSLEEYQENLGIIFNKILKKGGRPQFINICNGGEYRKIAEQTAKAQIIPFFDFPEKFKPYLSKVHDIHPEKFIAYFEAYGNLMEKKTQLAFLFPDLCHPNAIGHRLIAEILHAEGEVFN